MANAIRTLWDQLFITHRLHVSQAGQDYWVYGEVFNEKKGGFFLDVGAHDGVRYSNTFLLEKRYRWKGICVEGNPDTFKNLCRARSAICVNACLDGVEGEVSFAKRGVLGGIVAKDTDNVSDGGDKRDIIVMKTRTLESVLVENKAPSVIDYLSLDVEGAEDRVLLGFDFTRYQFNAVTIERPSSALREVLTRHGYLLIKEMPGLDCYFIHSSFQDDYMKNVYRFHRRKHRLLAGGKQK